MARFDQAVTREIHSRVDLGTFIGQYVSLKQRGNDLVGLCPFHGEKTPSFHVHPDRGFFKCFGCGASGDVIGFVQKLENVPFPEAVRMLAAKAGIELEPESPGASRARSEREALYEANHIAAAYFARMLKSEAGAAARAYCERRTFGEAAIEKFTLGYAPDAWSGLVEELRKNGVDLDLAAKAGLVKQGQSGGFYDFYRDRLMVPTYATTGEVIAFGGRLLGEGEPKYLNTSTTPVYTKGDHLFALNVARRSTQRERTLVVVEGYLDCIALHQAGIENAVASLGTSFTKRQAEELRKYADHIFLCFDGDAAGAGAATKAVEIASNVIEHTGSSVRVVMLPEGDDPDSFVRARGAAAFRALLDTAKPAIEYKLDPEIERLRSGFESPAVISRKAEALIREMTPREEWDRWRVFVAGRLKVNVDDLRNSRFLANSANFAPRSDAGRSAPMARLEPLSFEREVLSIVLEDPALAREYGERILPRRFRNEAYRRTYERIVEHADAVRDTADVFALCGDDEEAMAVLSALGARDRSSIVRYEDRGERRAHLDQVVARLELEVERERYQELSQRIDDLLSQGRPVSGEIRDEFDRLVTKLKR
ncbi:MAG TPA: DNA primase [Candidatus Baltobacteraceae bacterium]|nr:DNA primase [Candidatus Baltobacteraceae bacterium]